MARPNGKAKANATVLKFSDDSKERQYLAEGVRNGTIVVQEISMSKIVVNPKDYQMREVDIEMDHVRTLKELRDVQDGAFLHPIVTFLMPDGWFLLVDGFHRHRENKSRRCISINAYVVNVPDWQYQALLFATMCNQRTLLKRSPADKRKAVLTVCGIPECERWTDAEIAHHCGVHPETAKRIRKEHAIRNRRDLPAPRPKARPTPGVGSSAPSSPSAPARPGTLLPGEEADPKEYRCAPLGSTQSFRGWMLNRGVFLEASPPGKGGLHVPGFLADGRAVVLCATARVEDVYEAIGRVVVFGQMHAADGRRIVCLAKQAMATHRKLYAYAKAAGIEVLSPEELIDDIKAEKGEGKGSSVA